MKAAIRVGPIMFTGKSHAEALARALASEFDVPTKRKFLLAKDNGGAGFVEDDGTFLTRAECQAKHGFSTSEEMP